MKGNHGLMRAAAMIFQLGICVLVPVAICVALGVWLQPYIGVVGSILLMIVGLCAGARSAYVLAGRMVEKDPPPEPEYDLMQGWEGSRDMNREHIADYNKNTDINNNKKELK